jgi:hypothetical protein
MLLPPAVLDAGSLLSVHVGSAVDARLLVQLAGLRCLERLVLCKPLPFAVAAAAVTRAVSEHVPAPFARLRSLIIAAQTVEERVLRPVGA